MCFYLVSSGGWEVWGARGPSPRPAPGGVMFPFQAVAKRSASAGGDEGCSFASVMQHSLNGQKESLGSLCARVLKEGGWMQLHTHRAACWVSGGKTFQCYRTELQATM